MEPNLQILQQITSRMAEKQRLAELASNPKTNRSLKTIVKESRQNQPSQLAAAKKKLQQQYQNNRQHMSYFEKIRMMLNIKDQNVRQTTAVGQTRQMDQNRIATLEDQKQERSVSRNKATNRLSLLPSKHRQNLTSQAPNQQNESLERPVDSLKHTLTMKRHLNSQKTEMVKYSGFEALCEHPLKTFAELQLSDTLGVGAGACVRLATDRSTQKTYAVKIYEKYKLLEPRKMKSVRREIKLLQQLRHENIVQLLNAYENKRQIHLVMEYFEGVTLLQYFRQCYFNIPPEEVKLVIRQLLFAVQEMHSSNIAHRDVKLENALINSQGQVKLIDFGFATSTLTRSEVNCGTPNYMSPELYDKACNYAADKVDVWAVGVCAFYLVEGGYPFRGYDEKDLARKIREGRYTIRKGDAPFQRFLQRSLAINPNERATASQLLMQDWLLEPQTHSASMDIEHIPRR